MANFEREPMLDMFLFETRQMIEQLEQSVISSEKNGGFGSSINEIFRIMHTIKGSASMMLFNAMAVIAHTMEDLFFYIRETKPKNVDYSKLSDIVLEGIDFFKIELAKIEVGRGSDGETQRLEKIIKEYLESLKELNPDAEDSKNKKKTKKTQEEEQKFYVGSSNSEVASNTRYLAVIYFTEGCEMENIRAFSVVHRLKEIAEEIKHNPENIIDNDDCNEIIQRDGFKIEFCSSLDIEGVSSHLSETVFLKDLKLDILTDKDLKSESPKTKRTIVLDDSEEQHNAQECIKIEEQHNAKDQEKELINVPVSSPKQSIISVSVDKLDKLMDLVGELVISQAMVTKNPELEGLQLDSFHKASRQLLKITNELQDIVMAIRMVPLSMTFQKMNRLVRDMGRKLNKEVELSIIGEETEVDKNIIDHLSDPLMHIIRNAIDHGIESAEERKNQGKSAKGNITLEAKNAGGDVWIIVKDNGKGLNKDKILAKAKEHGLVKKSECELTDREIYSYIFLPGFSTKDSVTEFSGRGVGMDVVSKNIEKIGGTVLVDSIPMEGTTISIKIPLTLAIIDGMTIKVGNSRYTLPTISIKESFRVREEDIITDTDENEMLWIRGQCHPVLRLHQLYCVDTSVTKISNGIVVMVENNEKTLCLFADALIGEQQVVVKALPKYVKKVKGIAGCTLLGDGNISLILDVAGLINF